jgi:hypothetical protein
LLRWAETNVSQVVNGLVTTAQESDYGVYPLQKTSNGLATYNSVAAPLAGNVGSSCFAMSTDMETSNGIEISGLNAEEQVLIFYFSVSIVRLYYMFSSCHVHQIIKNIVITISVNMINL